MKRTAVLAVVVLAAACMRQLPDQDLRITATPPAAKLPADELWKDFQRDAAAARRQYFGKAVDVTGKVIALESDAAGLPVVLFSEKDQHGVRARLLDERATDTAKAAVVGAKITLRCFCEGLTPQQDLLLKSCIRP
jgi:hypothetical protein